MTVTNFRKDLFTFVEKAIEGETVEFEHKGVKLRLVASTGGSKLARAVRRDDFYVVDPNSIVESDPQLMAEFEAEWKAEYEELYPCPSST
jgi:hypothetical protein